VGISKGKLVVEVKLAKRKKGRKKNSSDRRAELVARMLLADFVCPNRGFVYFLMALADSAASMFVTFHILGRMSSREMGRMEFATGGTNENRPRADWGCNLNTWGSSGRRGQKGRALQRLEHAETTVLARNGGC
jgi:hypothetical protein